MEMILPPKIRLYTDDGNTNPAVDLRPLAQVLHLLFCRWIAAHYHDRDFLDAIDHVATCLYVDYLVAGQPAVDESTQGAPTLPSFPSRCTPAMETLKGPKLRFFGDDSKLNGQVDIEEFRLALIPYLEYWLRFRALARDFIEAATNAASSVYHDYTISYSMGGLGGCKTAEQFVALPGSYRL